MPIFTRSFDFLAWLLPVSNHFPKAHRHSFTRWMLDTAFELREQLESIESPQKYPLKAHAVGAD